MARQWLIPYGGFAALPGFLNEDGSREWLVSGGTFVKEDQAAGGFTPDLKAYRFYHDNNGEASSTPLDSQDTNITVSHLASGWEFQLRLRVDETDGTAGAATDDFQLQYSKNSGAWTNVTGASSNVQAATAGLTNDGATTNRASNGISDPGAGSFVAGEQSTDGLVDNLQITASNFTELVYGLEIIGADVAAGDTLDFRLSGPSGMVNTVTPRVTLSAFAPDVNAFRFYDSDGDSDTATATAAQDTNINADISGAADLVHQLRLRVDETGSAAGQTWNDYQLQYSHNSGTYTDVNSSATHVESATAGLSNQTATANRASDGISDPGSGSFLAGEECTDGQIGNFTLTSGNFTEHAFGISVQWDQVSNGDTLDFRLVTPAGIANSVTPRITVTDGTSSVVPQVYHHRHHNRAG